MMIRASVKAAQRSDWVGWDGGQLIIRVTAIPQKGESNRYIEAHLASLFGLPKALVTIVRGRTSGHKTILVEGDESAIKSIIDSLPKAPRQDALFDLDQA